MSKLEWTKRTPKKAGFYLAVTKDDGRLVVASVTRNMWGSFCCDGYIGELTRTSFGGDGVPMSEEFTEWAFNHGFAREASRE